MIPIKDDNPVGRIPVVTVVLIVLNVLVFIFQLFMPPKVELIFAHHYGVVPAWLTGLGQIAYPPEWFPRFLTLLTYPFLHGGFLHLGGNMLYLWIFGNNVENAMGRPRFILFYFLGGVLSGLAQVVTAPSSEAPMIGASGAIAAVLGAYLVLYPQHKVVVLIWLLFFVRLIRIPALVVLGGWFFLQVLGAGGEGVAWMAHIGGFVAGLVLVRFFLPRPMVLH
ncbi:rhomboid family intramembrane serine protease [Dethiosulfatarculus sandiegensis]|uniref:rhomboid family intramembrane serine protease n=1 Tax=Dethiosulfatarculus sandiegensis TaxID=1429043 RepID=UPI0005C9A295|nr:rhomboid family intramembrane serine protease [Dethiosulfatarculus sandiegensis]